MTFGGIIPRGEKTPAFGVALVVCYLLVSLAAPLATVFTKSLQVYEFRLDLVEIEFQSPGGEWTRRASAAEWARKIGKSADYAGRATSRSRLSLAKLLPKRERAGVERFRLRDLSPSGGLILAGGKKAGDGWTVVLRRDLRDTLLLPARKWSAGNYADYFSIPSLRRSIANSLLVSVLTALIVVPLSFFYALALSRSRIPLKPFFRLTAMAPILVPSLLPGLGLIYLFGRQGIAGGLLFGHSIYGPIGIVMASVFYTFPHAFIIQSAALALADQRLYESAAALRASRWRIFRTVTLPGARYGIISAGFVAFTLTITDFGVPKVVGGNFNVLALDIYKQVVGQQNFQLGAVVSIMLLAPAALAFAAERAAARRQTAQLSSGSVPFSPSPDRPRDAALLGLCAAVALFIVGILATCQGAALFKFFPYDLSVWLGHYDFNRMDGGGWPAYRNSIQMAFGTATFGVAVVFAGAYLAEKAPGMRAGRGVLHAMAMTPMAVPGMVLGLAYIFFFNAPGNPLNALYGSMTLLIICTVTHFYTVAHLTATAALKQVDREFEAVSASLRQPVRRMFFRVTVPVCMPAILDISVYLFVNAMTTVSAVVFIYSPDTALASVAVLNMDDAGDIAPAAAMGMMIFYTCACARALHAAVTRGILARAQAWRARPA